MSWHFSRAMVEGFSEENSLDGAAFARWKSMPTAHDDSSSAKMKATCHVSPFGMMFVPSTAAPGEALLTWYLAGFPARTSVRLDSEKALMASTPGCGERWLASFQKPDPSLYLSKIRRICVLADLSECSKTLTAWGTTRRGVCLERKIVELRIRENACGLLPTPTTVGNELSPAMQKWPAHQRLMELLGRFKLPTLRASRWGPEDSHGNTSNWLCLRDALACPPTPRASDADRGGRGDLLQAWRGNKNSHLKSLPTPTANRYGSNRGGANGRTGTIRPSLGALTGGPWISFREWMMAWPLGWSGSAPLGTDRFQQWFDWHGRHSDHGRRDHK